jgi:hypothetical protein
MKELVPSQPQKTDAYSRIKSFTSNEESGVILTPTEEKMLVRWCHTQGLLAERKFSDDEIIDQLTERFDVSKYTARNDINHARALFVDQLKNAKKFALYHHARSLEKLFQEKLHEKSFAPYLPKLAAEVTRAWAALPEELDIPDVPAPKLVINVVNKASNKIEDARKRADALIEKKSASEYTEFEDLSNE